MESVNRLIDLLQRMDAFEEDPRDDDNPVVKEIISLATEYLTIGPNVHEYRDRLREVGYRVYPGDVDSFGWLTAYFRMKKGILLFG